MSSFSPTSRTALSGSPTSYSGWLQSYRLSTCHTSPSLPATYRIASHAPFTVPHRSRSPAATHPTPSVYRAPARPLPAFSAVQEKDEADRFGRRLSRECPFSRLATLTEGR